MSIIPDSKPKLSEAQVRDLLKRNGVSSSIALVGIRGYYLDSMGAKGKNDRGIYDDAMFVVTPHSFAAFNASVDPSVFRAGIATLRTGVLWYRKGKHGLSRKPPYVPYDALRPATPGEQVPVSRDGQTNPRPGVAINIHRGGNTNTYSEGCQTLPPAQYDAFIKLVYAEMDRAKLNKIPYLLLDEDAVDVPSTPVATPEQSLEITLRKQMERDKSLTQMLLDGAKDKGIARAWVLAIASRETSIVNMAGDGGHGCGVLQIDDRFHVIARTTDFTKTPRVLIEYGCQLLRDNLNWAHRNWPKYTDQQLLKIASAAYNAGQGGAKKGVVAGNADQFTAHGNYGADVLKRMEVFEKLLAEVSH